MTPTLKPGDSVLTSPLPYFFKTPKIGDMIVCKEPRSNRPIIKRIIEITGDKYFITGDNLLESTDSRQFGMIERKNIVGKVIYTLMGRSDV